jgi:hypothetical protein
MAAHALTVRLVIQYLQYQDLPQKSFILFFEGDFLQLSSKDLVELEFDLKIQS